MHEYASERCQQAERIQGLGTTFGMREAGRKPVGADHAPAGFVGMGHWRAATSARRIALAGALQGGWRSPVRRVGGCPVRSQGRPAHWAPRRCAGRATTGIGSCRPQRSIRPVRIASGPQSPRGACCIARAHRHRFCRQCGTRCTLRWISTSTTWRRSASTVARDPGSATSAGAGPRQRDDHALVGVIDQGASDTASARLSAGLAPAWLALRAWWRLLER